MSPPSPEFPQRSSPKPADHSLLDTVLEPEFTTTLFSVPLGFDYTQHVRSHDQRTHRIGTEGNAELSTSLPSGIAGSNDSERTQRHQQQIYPAETGNHDTQSTSSSSTRSSFDSLRNQVLQQKNLPTESREENATLVNSQPITPPDIKEYFHKTNSHGKDLQRHVVLPMTAISKPSISIQPQHSHMDKKLKHIPNFSRPFSKCNPPAILNATWRARIKRRDIHDDAEPELLYRYVRGRFDEHSLTTKIEMLRREVELLDERTEAWNKVVDVLEEAELEMAMEVSMEMMGDGDGDGD